MLTPKEKIRLLELQEKEKEPHVPFTTAQLEEFAARSVEYSNATLGHLNGFTDFLGAIAQWSKGVAYDNTRLLQEIYYLKSQYARFEHVNQLITLMLEDKTISLEEKRNDFKALIGEIETAISMLVFDEAAEHSVEPTVPNVGDSARKRGRKSKSSQPA